MGETAKLMARDFVMATGSTCPVQAHRFAVETGFTLHPKMSGETRALGDVFDYDATTPMDEQESAILELMARWILQRVGEDVSPESIAEVLDQWLGVNARDDGVSSASSTRA